MKTNVKKNPYATLSIAPIKAPSVRKSGIRSGKITADTDMRAKRGK